MSQTRSATLGGRALEMRKAGFGAFWQGVDAQEQSGDHRAATYAIIAAAAYWVDTGEKVFADWRAVEAWPMEDTQELVALMNIASEMNNPRRKVTNGSAVEAPLPSDFRPSESSPTA